MEGWLRQLVWRRANDCCEYCLIPVTVEDLPAEIDHVIPEVHGGQTIASNLALSCLHCNKHKGTNLTGIDPVTRRLVRLFHPRRHVWRYHFLGRSAYTRSNCHRENDCPRTEVQRTGSRDVA